MDPRFSLIRPQGDLVMRGLRVMVGGPESIPGRQMRPDDAEITEKIESFLSYAHTIQLDPSRQVLAQDRPGADGRIAGMCLWVPSPGRTAMLFTAPLSDFPEAADATTAAIAGALDDARASGVIVVQAMMEPSDAAAKTVFAAAGLSQLATLTYMERRPPVSPPGFALPPDLTLTAYEVRTHDHFRDAIAASYQGTLDCPALSGMRSIDDVILGHKAVGVFDPQLWAVLLRGERPVGCLLLAEIPARRALELVYLGLVPEARGQGLGRILMQRVLAISSRRGLALATLAVDAANVPAVRLYRRCGYSSVAQRVAMIRKLA